MLLALQSLPLPIPSPPSLLLLLDSWPWGLNSEWQVSSEASSGRARPPNPVPDRAAAAQAWAGPFSVREEKMKGQMTRLGGEGLP